MIWFWISFAFLICLIVMIIFLLVHKEHKENYKNEQLIPKIIKKEFTVKFDLDNDILFFDSFKDQKILTKFSIINFVNSLILITKNKKILYFLNEIKKTNIDYQKLTLILNQIKDESIFAFYLDNLNNSIYVLKLTLKNEIQDKTVLGIINSQVLLFDYREEQQKILTYLKTGKTNKTEKNYLSEVKKIIKDHNINKGLYIFLRNKKIYSNVKSSYYNFIFNYLFMNFLKEKYKTVALTDRNDILIIVKDKQKKDYDLLKVVWTKIIYDNLQFFLSKYLAFDSDENSYDFFLLFGDDRKFSFEDLNFKFNLHSLYPKISLTQINHEQQAFYSKIVDFNRKINNYISARVQWKIGNKFFNWIYFSKDYQWINNLYFLSKYKQDNLFKKIQNVIINSDDKLKTNVYILPFFSLYYFNDLNWSLLIPKQKINIIFELKDIDNFSLNQYFFENSEIKIKPIKIFLNLNSDLKVEQILNKINPSEIYLEQKYQSHINISINNEFKLLQIKNYLKQNPKTKLIWLKKNIENNLKS